MSDECIHPGCGEPKGKALGFCNAHYLRRSRGRDMDKPVRKHNATDEERFWPKVDRSGDCWLWTAAMAGDGNAYGVFRMGGRNVLAHRVSYAWAHGDIPDGYEVDHMCFNKACVNPAHLRLLNHIENGQNRTSANSNSKSGVRGVYMVNGRWLARAMINRVVYRIGLFDDLDDAEMAITKWRREHMPASIQDQRMSA